jgi:hypothetical protein
MNASIPKPVLEKKGFSLQCSETNELIGNIASRLTVRYLDS